MSHRPARTPCLGERVSALADGSMRDDVRDRALAHTLTCPACRDALDVERLTLERLRSLPQPQPSARLMAELFALGETGGPVPPRRGPGPGMPRPAFVQLAPPPASAGSVRPGGSSRPGDRRGAGRRSRALVVAAAGALGAGFVAAGVLSVSAGGGLAPSGRTPVAQLTVQPASGQGGPPQQRYGGTGFAPVMVQPAVHVPVAFPAGGRNGVRPAALALQHR